MLQLTPDDLFILQSLSLERLQAEFPEPLLYCELHLTKEHFLAIECFDAETMADVMDYLSLLKYWAWQITGAEKIQIFCQNALAFQVETQRELGKTWIEALEFGNSLTECNLMTNATLEAPATAPSVTVVPTPAAIPNNSSVTRLVLLSEVEQTLVRQTGKNIDAVREMIASAKTPQYQIGDQFALSSLAAAEIWRNWAGQVERELLGVLTSGTASIAPSTSEAAPEPADAKAESNGRGRRSSARAGAKVSKSEKAPEESKLATLKINLSNYKTTAQAALDLLAPNSADKQRRMAEAISMNKKTAMPYINAILDLYKLRDKDPEKVRKPILEAFGKIAAEATAAPAAEATEAPQPVAEPAVAQ
jgi:hypothetical protein